MDYLFAFGSSFLLVLRQSYNMASDAGEIAPIEKRVGETSDAKQTGLHRDAEVGPEMVDIDRIERVYS